ncbi:unnamed protein product, partial [Rotaria sp. Silwood1]
MQIPKDAHQEAISKDDKESEKKCSDLLAITI